MPTPDRSRPPRPLRLTSSTKLPAGWDPALHPEWTAPAGGANPYTMNVPVEQGVAGVAFPKGTKVTLTESLDSAQLPAALRWQGEPSFSIGSTNAVNEVSSPSLRTTSLRSR